MKRILYELDVNFMTSASEMNTLLINVLWMTIINESA